MNDEVSRSIPIEVLEQEIALDMHKPQEEGQAGNYLNLEINSADKTD